MVLPVQPGESSTCIDLLNVYQHVWRGSDSDEHTTQQRLQIWRASHSPQRNTRILAGDFNTSLPTLPPHVGNPIIPKDVRQPDQQEFLTILQDHGLTALNTWGADKPSVHTCITGQTKLQIDYVLCRVQHADGQAKQSRPQTHTSLGAWKANRHVPVQASIKGIRVWHLVSNLPKRPLLHTTRMCQSIASPDARTYQAQQDIRTSFDTLRNCPDLGTLINEMDSHIIQVAHQHFPPISKPDGRVSAQLEFLQITKQMSYNLFRKRRVACAGNILRLWRQWAHFQRASKAMRQQAQQTKRALILDVMHKLEDAAARNDLHQVYTQAKRLAPWNPASRSHLRGADGQILRPQE